MLKIDDFLSLCVWRSIREGAAGFGQDEVEEKKDFCEKENTEPLFQRVFHF